MTAHTLLLSDVVDSTQLTARLGDAHMARIWTAHDRLARDLLLAHRGREIDRTDGFLMLFDAVADAVGWAAAFHAGLARLSAQEGVALEARIGVHTGEVLLIENSAADVAVGAKPVEVEGLAKPYAARVMSTAAGGQTLLSEAAHAALGATALRVASHGHWRLKGVPQPVELFEIGPPDGPFAPPPGNDKVYRVVQRDGAWVPLAQLPGNLPAERDAFVGREGDLGDLARRLDDGARLVSVLGIGGTGKTRLVLRFARAWLGDWPGGAWFCDLSEARSVDGIVAAVGRALDVALGNEDAVTQLGHVLAARGRCLVILDNFEQVARLAPETLGRWLDRAAEAQFVVTTREILGLQGEQSLALAPLPDDDAADLFLRRAEAAKRDFAPGPDDRAAIAQLVRLLDGLPLAIELAAARVRVMPPRTLLQRMNERFKLLAGGGARQTRQSTLRATLDWSWDLLSPDEQAALAQLSVFEGGFALDAAEAVLVLEDAWPMDAVQALVDKSLVRAVGPDRFDLLVSVQEYADEQLRTPGRWPGSGPEAAIAAEARHGVRYASLAEDDDDPESAIVELDNLVATCRRAVVRGDATVAVPALAAAWVGLERKGPFGVARELAEAVVAMPSLSTPDRARAELVLGSVCEVLGRADDARAHLESSLSLARSAGLGRTEASALHQLGILLAETGRTAEAEERFQAALALYRAQGDPRREGRALGALGRFYQQTGQVTVALPLLERALAQAREDGDLSHQGNLLSTLGALDEQGGRWSAARERYAEALVLLRASGSRQVEAMVLENLGIVHYNEGDRDTALSLYAQAGAIARSLGDRRLEGHVLINVATVQYDAGSLAEARLTCDEGLAIAREVRARGVEGTLLTIQAVVASADGRVQDAIASYEGALAVQQEVGDPFWEAVSRLYLGHLFRDEGRLEEAGAQYEAAAALARGVQDPIRESAALRALAVTTARLGRFGEARDQLDAAGRVLGASEQRSPVHLDLARAELEHLAGAPAAARAALAQADAHLGPERSAGDEVLREYDRLRAMIGA